MLTIATAVLVACAALAVVAALRRAAAARARARELERELRRGQDRRELSEVDRRLMVDAMNDAYVAFDAEGRVTDWNRRATEMLGYTREEAIGRLTPELIVPPEDRDEFWWLLERFTTGKRASETLDLRVERRAQRKDGSVLPIELAAVTLHHEGEVTLHTFMHDISGRRRDREALEAHAADVEALAEATAALARSTTAAGARQAICNAALEIAEADLVLLHEPTADGSGLVVSAAGGADRLAGRIVPFVGEPSAAIRAFTSQEPLFVADLEADPAIGRPLVRLSKARSGLWAPVRRGEVPLGVIGALWREPAVELPERVVRIMQLVASEAAVAIERASLLERLEQMAQTDELTGLPNRRAWDRELARELSRCRRSQTTVSVAMIDLDEFKAYNDEHGHLAGDRLLKEAAGRWRAALRDTDLIARYGGEEFTISLPGCDSAEAEQLVERLRAVTPEGQSCSAGLAAWDGRETGEQLLGRADRALYEAKQSGRDRTVVV